MKRQIGISVASFVLLGLMIAMTDCAHARHVAVVADQSFAQAVFALDDAETAACQTHVLTVAQCAAADPKIKQALLDVKALTLSLQATPKNVAVPKGVPDLLTDLTAVQAILAPASGIPQAAPVVAKGQAALTQVILLLRQFTGA